MALRERQGLAPIDDALPNESPNAFRKIIEFPAPSQEGPARRGPYPGQITSDGVTKMRSDLMTTTRSVIELDGLSGGYLDDSGQGDDDRTSSRVIQGGKLKFDDPNWYLDGRVVTGQLLTIIAMRKVVNKWTADGKPLETQILLPSDPFPDFKALNEACPKSEWFEKFGKLMGPYQGQRALYFIDQDYNRYTWASPAMRYVQTDKGLKIEDTIGSAICVREVMEQIELVRRHRGPDVFPVAPLEHCDFKTVVGLKQRPYLLKFKEWIKLTPGRVDPAPAVDAAPVAEIISQTSPMAVKAGGAPADAQLVPPLTAKEVVNDEIPH